MAQRPVTFDPLGVAAVLHNPRADSSAAMLYTQYFDRVFTWPHTTMFGGTLPAIQMLWDHLTRSSRSVHPAVGMCAKVASTPLPVRTDVSSVIQQLPLNASDFVLNDIVSYPASDQLTTDLAVVLVKDNRFSPTSDKARSQATLGFGMWRTYTVALDLIGLLNGLVLMAGVVVGVFVADLWAATLFFTYTCHWIATAGIARSNMVRMRGPPLPEDPRIGYAIYQREHGGMVVFKGRRDILQNWSQSKLNYTPTLAKDCLHWAWIISGAISGLSSVACLVNAYSYMQLAFLGMLIYGSVADIVAVRISRILQSSFLLYEWDVVLDNQTMIESIIRATLEIDSQLRLQGLDWIHLNVLPSTNLFQYMQRLLLEIGRIQSDHESDIRDVTPRVYALLDQFISESEDEQRGLAEKIRGDICHALNRALHRATTRE